jgi:hypothetical protein
MHPDEHVVLPKTQTQRKGEEPPSVQHSPLCHVIGVTHTIRVSVTFAVSTHRPMTWNPRVHWNTVNNKCAVLSLNIGRLWA